MDLKILIISDSHRDARVIDEVIERESPFDILVHCGDMEGSLFNVEQRNNPFTVHAVRGNCDGPGHPQETCFRAGHYNIFVTHGHKYGVHHSVDDLLQAGKKQFADVILYGHTHVPEVTENRGILIVNPGSIALPKQSSKRRSYAILTISEDSLPEAEIRYLDDLSTAQDTAASYNVRALDLTVRAVMNQIDKGMKITRIAEKNSIPVELAEKICRMYLTHPGITVDGILERIYK